MIKVALLIRVADPDRDLQPGTANEVATLQQVLLSAIGDFTEVETLNNPEPIAMQQAIEALFGDRHPDDLVLLYFSGQTLKDDRGKLYWATRATWQDVQGKLVKSTAIATDFLQDVMNDSHAQQQVVILDCWLGGMEAEVQTAITAMQEQLGGPGRVILTAAITTQNGHEHQRSDRSTYTDYLVEGLETGAADLDHDGIVSLNELHEYTCRKLQRSAPAIQPEIYLAAADNQIQIGKIPVSDSQLRYRQEVERCANGGISIVSRSVLDLVKDQLGLAPEVATVIEGQVLKPYQVYQQNLQRYAQAVVKAIHQEYPLTAEVRDRLNRVQQVFGLRDQDTAPIEVQAYQVKVEQSAVKIPLPQQTLPNHPATPRSATPTIDSLSSVDVASQTTTPGLITPATRNHEIRQKNRWLLIAAIAPLVLGVVYSWHQWQVTRQLQSLQALAAVRDYQKCLEVGTTSVRNPQTQKLLQQCQAGATWQNVQVQSLLGHLDSIWSVAISPDGQTLASGSNDRTIKLWSVRTGRLLRTLTGHSSDVLSVAISPDGQTLASGSWDKTIKIWHLPTGRLLHTLSGHSHEVWSVAISPDGQTLASGSNDRTIKLWSVRTGRLLRTLTGHSSDVLSVAISPDGQTLASGSKDRAIKLWNLSTGRLVRTLSGHSDLLRSVNFTPDGQLLASSSWDRTIKIWHLPTGELSRTLSGHSSYVNAIAISSNQTLASGSDDNTIKLWNLQTGQLLRTLTGHSSHVNSVAFSPDGKVLTSGSQDKGVKIWRQ